MLRLATLTRRPTCAASLKACSRAFSSREQHMFKSPWPPVTIPKEPLPHIVLKAAETCSSPTAGLVDTKFSDSGEMIGTSVTYQQLPSKCAEVAASLQARGLKKGDVVAINSTNHSNYAIAFHAVLMAGGIVSPASPQHGASELADQLLDSSSKFLVTSPEVATSAIEAAKTANMNLENVFVIRGEEMEHSDAPAFSSLFGSSSRFSAVDVGAEDVCCLPYSSGTTGKPKGVVLSHYNLVSNLFQVFEAERLTSDDALVGVLPFFHIYGLMIILNTAIYANATVGILSQFDLEVFLQTLKHFRVTRAHIAPPLAVALAKHPLVDKYAPYPDLKMLFSGAAPLSAEVELEACSRLDARCKQAYGMTEMSPASHVSGDEVIKQGSVGPLVPNTEALILNTSTGNPCKTHEAGEICIRGPQVMKEYLNRPDATAETIDNEGFLHTGDIGYVDEDGFFFIVDRVKELIKYKGHQVAPAELEAVILTHPDVADVAVCRSYDKDGMEIPKAFVVLKQEKQTSASDIMNFVAERVAPYKKIRAVEFLTSVPKSPSGKILRRLLTDN